MFKNDLRKDNSGNIFVGFNIYNLETKVLFYKVWKIIQGDILAACSII